MSTPQEKAIADAEAYKKEIEEKLKKQPLRVEIDASGTVNEIEKLAREKAEAEAKLENRAKMEVGKEVIERLMAKATELGVEFEEPKTLEDFEALAVIVKKIEAESRRKPPTGSIPIAGNLKEEDSEGFSDYPSMIDFLRDAENSQEKEKQAEAQQILDELWRKAFKFGEETKKSLSIEQPKELKKDNTEKGLGEQISERFRRRRREKNE